MLSVEQALDLVLAEARPRPAERIAMADSLGLVLAEDVASDVDSPPYDKSAVDGYAIRSEDLAGGLFELAVIEEVTAGCVPQKALAAGQASRVMTGAPIPAGADTMVMIERTETVGSGASERVRIQEAVATQTTAAIGSHKERAFRRGQNIVTRGTYLQRGAVTLRSGCEIRPIEIGILAEVGRSQISAIPRPSVAVLPTGNELVDIGETPGPGQIRNSNGPLLLAAATRAGAQAIDLGIGRDDTAELERLIVEGLQADILVISGGVSAGVLDLVPGVLERLGVERVLYKVDMKPGKPLWFGVLRSSPIPKLVFGLPGNPVSSLVCFELFVRPALARLAGRAEVRQPAISARLASDFTQRGDRPTYFPARLCFPSQNSQTPDVLAIEPLAWHGSGDLATLAQANALAKFPAGQQLFPAGTVIEAIRL
jgi:molybdopterin molybdotransferase